MKIKKGMELSIA